MSSISVKPLVPHEMVIDQPKSTSAHVLRKRQVEVIPSENTNFSFETNDRIVINLSSQTEFLDASSGYLRGTITSVMIDANDNKSVVTRALDEGGIMACFKNIELRTQSGVLIERWDRANRLYALLSNATHPRYFVESAMGDQLDSIGWTDTEVDQFSSAGALETYKASRNQIATDNAVEFSMKIPLGFFNMKNYIPLYLIKQGLQLILELDRPELVQNSHVAIIGALESTITLSKVRYIATMITPDESVVQQYLNEFNNDGINYTFESFRHRRKNVGASQTAGASNSYQFGVRSARAVFSVIQSAKLSDTASSAAQNYDSISTFLSTNITKYQYKSGAEEYPTHEVDVNANSMSEVYAELMLAVNQFGSTLHQTRFLPYQWRPENTVATVGNESIKLILAADLSRGNSPWTGLDLSINNLDLELEFDGVSDDILGNRILHTWVLHDVMCSISRENGLVIRK